MPKFLSKPAEEIGERLRGERTRKLAVIDQFDALGQYLTLPVALSFSHAMLRGLVELGAWSRRTVAFATTTGDS